MPSSLGPAEILVILVVALIVLGPNKLPQAGRQLGKALSEVRRWTTDMKSEIKTVVDFEERPSYSSPEYPSSPTSSTTVTADPQPLTVAAVAAEPEPAPPASEVDAESDSAVSADPAFSVAAEPNAAAMVEPPAAEDTSPPEAESAGPPEAPQGDSAQG